MTDDDPTEQERELQAFLKDVQARLQQVEDILMSREWEGIIVRTEHGAFEWTLGAVEGPPRPARRKPGTRRKPLSRR